MERKLTAEQQQIVIDTQWVVNTALKQLGLSHDEDWQSIANIELIKCAMRFDRLKGVKFSTFAYKSIILAIKRIRSREKAKMPIVVALENAEQVAEREYIDVAVAVAEIKSNLSPIEKQVVELIEQGLTIKETRLKLNLTRSEMINIRTNIKYKRPPY